MKIAIVGTGYVGLTTGVALAFLGHDVVGIDKDPHKLDLLRSGRSPIHEAGLEALLHHSRARLRFTDRVADAVADAEIIMIAVGTPSQPDGAVDCRYVETATREVAAGMREGRSYIVVIKSTVPAGTHRRAHHVLQRELAARGLSSVQVHTVSNPEFLREGKALSDTLYPERIVVGADAPEAIDALRSLYAPILDQSFSSPSYLPRPVGFRLPVLVHTEPTSAEMIKYAANAFLALKISYINEIAGLCDRVGADVADVARGIGLDSRIGAQFLGAGIGWGGSCFPKDTAALISLAGEYDYAMPIVAASRVVNARQCQLVVQKLQAALKVLRGRTITVLGLAFKPGTDDVRDAPALAIIETLHELGAHVRAHDPIAVANARRAIAEQVEIEFFDDVYEAAAGADGAVLATEWDVYRDLEIERFGAQMRRRVMLDGRNLFTRERFLQAGFEYIGIGR